MPALPDTVAASPAHHICIAAIRYQLDNVSPADYALSRDGLEAYAAANGVTPNQRAAISGLYNRCRLNAAKMADVPILLDVLHKEAARLDAVRAAKAGDLYRAVTLAEAGGVKAGSIDALKRARDKAEKEEKANKAGPDGLRFTDWAIVDSTVRWLWNDHLPIGVSLLAGIGGVGKSTLMLNVAASITQGRYYSDGQSADLGDVILILAEDDAGVVKQRFIAQGGDLGRLHHFKSKVRDGREHHYQLEDADLLHEALEHFPQTKLVIIDPIHAFTGKIDSHNNSEVRRVVTPLSDLAGKMGVAVVGIIHFGKDNQKASFARISGSGAWRDLARSVFVATRDKADENLCLLIHEKHNYSARQPTMGYRFDTGTMAIKWDTTVQNVTADQALSWGADTAPKLDAAKEWLRDHLANGERPALAVIDAAKAVGISKDTLYRAKEPAGVQSRRDGFGGPCLWSISNVKEVQQADDDDAF